MKEKQALWGKLALLLATLIWGSSFLVMKSALDNIGTCYLLAIRFTGAFILLGIIFHKRFRQLNKEYIIHGFWMGSWLISAYIIQTVGLVYTTPGKNAFLTATYCVLVPFFFWGLTKEKPDIFNLIAAALCIVGIGFVSLGKDFSMGFGDILSTVCGIFYAIHIVISAKYTMGKVDVILLTIVQFFFAALWSWCGGLLFEQFPSNLEMSAWMSLAYLSVFATAVALCCQMVGIQKTTPAVASLILSLEAVFGVMFSVLAGAEGLTLQLVIGFILIFLAMMVSETKLEFIRKKL